jgi:hypothetical protein
MICLGVGNAKLITAVSVTGIASIQSLSQTAGSTNGGSLLTIDGNGFSSMQNTTVKIGNNECVIQSLTQSKITCIIPSNSAGNYSVAIKSNGVNFPSVSFFYTSSLTPMITQLSPISGLSNQLLTITGSGFGNTPSKIVFSHLI